MPTPLTEGTISDPYLQFDPDKLSDATTMPNATDSTTDEFLFGYTQGGNALRYELTADTTFVNGDQLQVNLLHRPQDSGAYQTVPLFDTTFGADATYQAGDTLFPDYIANDLGPYCKLQESTVDDLSAIGRDVYLRYVSR